MAERAKARAKKTGTQQVMSSVIPIPEGDDGDLADQGSVQGKPVAKASPSKKKRKEEEEGKKKKEEAEKKEREEKAEAKRKEEAEKKEKEEEEEKKKKKKEEKEKEERESKEAQVGEIISLRFQSGRLRGGRWISHVFRLQSNFKIVGTPQIKREGGRRLISQKFRREEINPASAVPLI